VALDVLKVPGQPSRIIVWGGLLAGQSYANGRLQVRRYDPVQRALIKMTRFNGGLFEFEQGHQPVLLTFPMLHRLREDIGVQGDPLAEVLATPLIGSSRTFLTFRTSQVGVVDAYDQNTLERVPSSANLNLGPGGVLLGIVDDLLLTIPEPVLPGSAFVVLENATDGGTVIRFKRVTPDGRIIPGKLMGTSTPGAGVSLSASPASQSITAGQSPSYTITINRTNYMGPVSLGC
jgi:hypothetical protein